MKRSVEAGKIHRIKIGAAIQRERVTGWKFKALTAGEKREFRKKSVIQLLLLLFLLNIRTEDRETRERKGRY